MDVIKLNCIVHENNSVRYLTTKKVERRGDTKSMFKHHEKRTPQVMFPAESASRLGYCESLEKTKPWKNDKARACSLHDRPFHIHVDKFERNARNPPRFPAIGVWRQVMQGCACSFRSFRSSMSVSFTTSPRRPVIQCRDTNSEEMSKRLLNANENNRALSSLLNKQICSECSAIRLLYLSQAKSNMHAATLSKLVLQSLLKVQGRSK